MLSIDCMPSTGNTPLFPIAVLLRRTANIASTASEAEKRAQAERLLARALPDEDPATALAYLAPLFGLHDIAIPEEVTPAAVRDRTIELVVGMLESAGGRAAGGGGLRDSTGSTTPRPRCWRGPARPSSGCRRW